MIKVTKVDLHSLNVDRLNEEIDAGWKPVAYVPYGAKMMVFLEGEEKIGAFKGLDEITPINTGICAGVTKAGNPCKAAVIPDSEYCVAHQDQG